MVRRQQQFSQTALCDRGQNGLQVVLMQCYCDDISKPYCPTYHSDDVRRVARATLNQNAIYDVTPNGVYRSPVNHPEWTRLDLPIDTPSTSLLVQDEVIVVGTNASIIKSTDDGQNWQAASLGLPIATVVTVAASDDLRRVWAGTLDDGVFCSDDGGQTWRAWNFGLIDPRILSLKYLKQRLVVGTETGLFISQNVGRSWHSGNTNRRCTMVEPG